MTTSAAPSVPVGLPMTLANGREAWIRVSPAGQRLAEAGRHWHRWVVDATDRRVAAASYWVTPSGTAHGAIWVASAWRRAGLGRRLMSMLTAAAADHDVKWLTFETSTDDVGAARLCAGSGWIVARRVRGRRVRLALLLPHDGRADAADLDDSRAA